MFAVAPQFGECQHRKSRRYCYRREEPSVVARERCACETESTLSKRPRISSQNSVKCATAQMKNPGTGLLPWRWSAYRSDLDLLRRWQLRSRALTWHSAESPGLRPSGRSSFGGSRRLVSPRVSRNIPSTPNTYAAREGIDPPAPLRHVLSEIMNGIISKCGSGSKPIPVEAVPGSWNPRRGADVDVRYGISIEQNAAIAEVRQKGKIETHVAIQASSLTS